MRVPLIDAPRVLLPGTTMVMRLRALPAGIRVHGDVALRYRTEVAGASQVGTIVQVTGLRTTDEGDALLEVAVTTRIRVESVDGVWADVVIEDPIGDRASAEAARAAAVRALRGYLAAMAEHGRVVDILQTVPSEPVAASYRLASCLEVTAPERHELLALPTAAERLAFVERLLRMETALLRATL